MSSSTFLDDVFSTNSFENRICYPGKKCRRRFWHYKEDIYDHLIVDEFFKGFKQRFLQKQQPFPTGRTHEKDKQQSYDNIFGLLQDTFKHVENEFNKHEGYNWSK